MAVSNRSAPSPGNGRKRGAPLRLWWRALSVKRPQAILALLSLMVGAAVISMLLNLYGGVRRKMTQEFRGYGANVVLAPVGASSISQPHPLIPSPVGEGNQDRVALTFPTGDGNQGWGGTMDQAVLNSVHAVARQGRGLTALPVLYAVVHLERIPPDPRSPDFVNVVAVGTDLAGMIRMNPGWRESHVAQALLPAASTDASRAAGAGKSVRATTPACVVGSHLASRLRIASGGTIHFEPLASFNPGDSKAAVDCRTASVLTTGSSEEDQVFLPLDELQRVMGMLTRISLVQLRLDGDTREIESSIRELSKALPGVDVRSIRQIVYSEGRVLGVIQWFLLALTGLILVIIVICLTATMTAIALERRKDIGVMKALGASDFGVMRMFLAEGAALGATGGCAGFVIGSLGALGLADRLFGVTLNVIWWTLPLVCGLTTLLALAAAVFLVGVVRATQPAVVLKGD
jgi:putative ABC transport system permease protein